MSAVMQGLLAVVVSFWPMFGPCFGLMLEPVWADTWEPHIRLGTQQVGLSAGPLLPWRVKPAQSTKLFGAGVVPSWSMTLTDPIGSGWYQGQLSLGAELVFLRTSDPMGTTNLAFTPRMAYAFTALKRFHPYLEGSGGPMWAELGGRIPEQPSEFNFLVMAGGGVAWFLGPNWSINLGGRFYHMSNGGTRSTNRGVNFGFPYLGFSWYLF